MLSIFNLSASSSLPVRLGSSILKPEEAQKFRSVRYNHRPQLEKDRQVSCSVQNADQGKADLVLTNGDTRLRYKAERTTDGARYVLFGRGRGKNKELVLERLQGWHDFNLCKTSSEIGSSELAEQYPRLPIKGDFERGAVDEEDGIEGTADRENPFDFRNYLKETSEVVEKKNTGSPNKAAASASVAKPNAKATPLAKAKKVTDTTTPLPKKRKVTESSQGSTKRVKAGAEPPQPQPPRSTSTSSKPKPTPDVPAVRLDRKATLRRPSIEDSGELILENETLTSAKPYGAMAIPLPVALGSGPISLRSAASSPASMNASPMPVQRAQTGREDDEIDLGGSSDGSGDETEDHEADAPVDDLEPLPPADAHAERDTASHVTEVPQGEEECDLDKALAEAFEAAEDQAEPMAQPVAQAEESEESEEE